jgi:hypothetical protein
MRREARRVSSSNGDAASADAATAEHDDNSVDERYGCDGCE